MNNPILAIDPGPVLSGYVIYTPLKKCNISEERSPILGSGKIPNEDILDMLNESDPSDIAGMELVIEMVASYGMPVGKSVFDTCVWIGRFIQAGGALASAIYLYTRNDVKMTICHSMRAKDATIRQALIDMFPATGGGKVPQIGTVKKPGPLYGVAGDVWSALALAITHLEDQRGPYSVA